MITYSCLLHYRTLQGSPSQTRIRWWNFFYYLSDMCGNPMSNDYLLRCRSHVFKPSVLHAWPTSTPFEYRAVLFETFSLQWPPRANALPPLSLIFSLKLQSEITIIETALSDIAHAGNAYTTLVYVYVVQYCSQTLSLAAFQAFGERQGAL